MNWGSGDVFGLIGEFLSCRSFEITQSGEGDGISVVDNTVTFAAVSTRIAYLECKNLGSEADRAFLHRLIGIYLTGKDQSDCLGSVTTHELKNILASAQLSLEMLTAYEFDPPDRNRLLSQAFEAVSSSVTVFDEMLQVEKLRHEQKNKKIETETVNLAHIVTQVLKAHKTAISAKNITAAFEDETDAMPIEGSAFWLERALFNLVSNAVKYNKLGGRLTIRLRSTKKERVELAISDTGIGIEPHEGRRIFEKFFTSSRTGSKGIGVGLALVRSVCDVHGGTIRFAPNEGGGTTFVLLLPVRRRVKRIANPMVSLGAASVVLLLVGSYLFPLIPVFDPVGKSGVFTTIDLADGSRISVQNARQYSFWHLRNLTGTRHTMRMRVDAGLVEADIKGSQIHFLTPSADFVNLGTRIAFDQQGDTAAVSVYEGALRSQEQDIAKGFGFVSQTDEKIAVVKILEPPYGTNYRHQGDGRLSISVSAVKGAMKYRWTLAKDREFHDVLSVADTKEPGYISDIQKDGFYYLKVVALDAHGIAGYPNTAVVKNLYHLHRGIAYRDGGDFAKAVAMFERSDIEFDQKEYRPYSELGWTYYLRGDNAGAVRYFEEALRRNATEQDTARLARSFYHLREYARAGELYDGMLGRDPYNQDALWGKSEIQIVLNDPVSAKALLSRLLEINPRYPLGNYDMSRVLIRQGNIAEAKRYLQRERDFNPGYRDMVEALEREIGGGRE